MTDKTKKEVVETTKDEAAEEKPKDKPKRKKEKPLPPELYKIKVKDGLKLRHMREGCIINVTIDGELSVIEEEDGWAKIRGKCRYNDNCEKWICLNDSGIQKIEE